MKVVAINGSPRAEGNTYTLLSKVAESMARDGVETEIIGIGRKKISGCSACYKCFENADRLCSMRNDIFNEIAPKVWEADGLIIGSPTYFTDVSAETKAFIDRIGITALANGRLLKHKVGAAVVAVRRGGGIHAFDTINHLFQMHQMFIVGSTYWNLGFGRNEGEVNGDTEGMDNMADLGKSISFLLQKTVGPSR